MHGKCNAKKGALLWRFMRQICRTCRHNIVWPVCIDGCRHTATGQAGTVQLHVRRCHAQGALVSAAVDTVVELKVHPLLPVPVARLVLDIYPFQYCQGTLRLVQYAMVYAYGCSRYLREIRPCTL